MRTNIEIDDRLMADAIEATGLPTKKAVVEAALRALLLLDAARDRPGLDAERRSWAEWNVARKKQEAGWRRVTALGQEPQRTTAPRSAVMDAGCMRTNIEIDEQLMNDALKAAGLPTKRAVVEVALRALLMVDAQRKILEMAGQVEFWPDWREARKDGDPHRDWDIADEGPVEAAG